MANYASRVIGGLTHEQWREKILQEIPFDPSEFLHANKEQEEVLNETARKLNLALMHLDAMFGIEKASQLTYRMAIEASTEKFRIAMLQGGGKGKMQGLAMEVPQEAGRNFMNALLRGEMRVPQTRAPVATLLEKDVKNSMRHLGDKNGIKAACEIRDAEVLKNG